MNGVGTVSTAILSTLALSACSEPESLTLSPMRQPGAYQETCNVANQFTLVGGDRYVGAIIPESYMDKLGAQNYLRVQGFWTPERDDVRAAETKLPFALTGAIQHPETIDEASRLYPPRASVAKQVIERIAQELPKYRRHYAGLVIDGKRQVLIRCFLPSEILGPGWLCSLVEGNDFGEELWQIRYGIESQTYEGFEFGS